ncbi:hypothetical protein FOZ62_022845 [Perkinsus olseni]|uniref:RING-type domain-containing protein n=1 Tax=Perkinsus olseni TaxID=32597 RepID=A0A7J6T8B7_PEROL|nr:hypothetical protein FOZ62_022845 [Perkinsus olseni]
MGNCLSPAGGGAPISIEEVKKFVDDEIRQNNVMVFSKSYCPHCKRAKNALNSIGADYKVVELDGRPDCAAIQDYLNEITGARTVPRVFIDGKCIGGGSETTALKESGELQKMLGKTTKEEGVIGMPRKHKSRSPATTPSSASSSSTGRAGVNRSIAQVSKAQSEYTTSLQPHVSALSKALGIILTKRWLLLPDNSIGETMLDDATQPVLRKHSKAVGWITADLTRRAEQLLVDMQSMLEDFQKKHAGNLGRIIRHLDGIATAAGGEGGSSTETLELIKAASSCAAEMMRAVEALLDRLAPVDISPTHLKDEATINTWTAGLVLPGPTTQLCTRASDTDDSSMGQQESRTLPPLPQQRVIRLNPDGTSSEAVLNPAGSVVNAPNTGHPSICTEPRSVWVCTDRLLQVDRSSFRVESGKVVFTLVYSADTMVTVYMNAINKYEPSSSSRGRRLHWPVLSYEHSQSKRVPCAAPDTQTTTLEFDLEPATVMLKAMSEQHWPLAIEVFVAATHSSTLMYLSAADAHATTLTVSEQIHKLPNGKVVATGALYGLADMTKNGESSGAKSRDTCSICLTNPINTALLPCGHTALCYDCARLLQQDPSNANCPICRARVISSVTLDIS